MAFSKIDLPTDKDAVRSRLQKLYELRERKEQAVRLKNQLPGDDLVKEQCKSLLGFVEYFWSVLEPATPFVSGWALEAMCEHLEAVTDGRIQKLLINVPPGSMKSLLTEVFWPAWEWGPMEMPHLRYVSFAYAAHLTERDNRKFLSLVRSPDYQRLWPNVVLAKKGEELVSNSATGSKLATGIGGVGTGERGDRVILDDPHNIADGESDIIRTGTVDWFRQAMNNRLNNMDESAIIVIMQRVHEDDVSGTILANDFGYEHLCIRAEHDTSFPQVETSIGWSDPRTEDGEIFWPERFPENVIESLKITLGPYGWACQYMQTPEPKGGGVIKREWWLPWESKEYPMLEYIVGSIDTAYTIKKHNDPSAMTIWGMWRNEHNLPKLILMNAWEERLEMHDLVNKVAETCRKFKIDKLLIEGKASGHSVEQELRRLYNGEKWSTQLINPTKDKLARAYAVQHIWAEGLIYAPDRPWADKVIDQLMRIPLAKHDDLADSATMAVKHLRDSGWALRKEEQESIIASEYGSHKPVEALYDC